VKAVADHRAGDQRPLIKAATAAMHHEHRQARAALRVFDALAARRENLALARDAVVGKPDLPQVHARDDGCSGQHRHGDPSQGIHEGQGSPGQETQE
jgi:hypothetical protein